MMRVLACGLIGMGVLAGAQAQEAKYAIKTAQTPVPKEIAGSIQKLLAPQSVQLLDASGKVICELWFRAEVPVEASADQLKTGLTYREVKQTELMGAVRFNQDWRDYRQQKVKAGTYTLRLGLQPMDGDHMGSSDFQDFLVLLDAAKDTMPGTMEPKHMIEASVKSIGAGHPGVFMLFPNSTPGAAPALAAMPKNHWVLQTKEAASVGGKSAGTNLGIGLTLVGAAD